MNCVNLLSIKRLKAFEYGNNNLNTLKNLSNFKPHHKVKDLIQRVHPLAGHN